MVNRGACLGWLSQYPDEREILMPVRITECSTRMAVVSPLSTAVESVLCIVSEFAKQACSQKVLTRPSYRLPPAAAHRARGDRIRAAARQNVAVHHGAQH